MVGVYLMKDLSSNMLLFNVIGVPIFVIIEGNVNMVMVPNCIKDIFNLVVILTIV